MARDLTPSRPLTGLERVWLVSDRLWPPFVNHLVVEGDGAPDAAAWRRAVETVLPAWPGARARLRGALGFTRWVADGAPPVVTVAEPWDGRGPAGFLARRLDPWAGPVVEVILAGDRVVLRTHHAAFDGRAAWALAEDLGAALRGEPVRGAAFAGVTDTGIAGPGPVEVAPSEDAALPTGRGAAGDEAASTWVRVSLPPPGRGVLPRVIAALGHAAAPGTPALRVSVPVDLRRHAEGARVCANLTGFVRLRVESSSTAADVAAALERALAARDELGPVRAAARLRAVPLSWMEAAGRSAARRALTTGLGATSATVSNLGRMDPGVFAAPGYRPRRLFWLPPPGAGSPLFLTLTGHPEGVELCAGMPLALADGGRLDALVERIVAELAG